MEEMQIKKSDRDVWTGTYRGVGFEINNFSFGEGDRKDKWTHYIFIHLDRIPEKYKPNSFWLKGKKNTLTGDRVNYDYYKHHVIGTIEFHGGITWYSKEHGFDGSNKVIKIGCDYQHYWDEGNRYDVEYVQHEVKNTIDSFLEKIPNYKYWCRGNGKLYDLKDGVIINGSFHSYEYWKDNEWFKEQLSNMELNTIQ